MYRMFRSVPTFVENSVNVKKAVTILMRSGTRVELQFATGDETLL